jgi:AcrR family transcriptional regulator
MTNLNPVQLARRSEIGEERRARTRARLMQTAYQLFAIHGANAPTIDDVVAHAKVARGTFYNHFKTRDELFNAVADEIATSINAIITRAEAEIRDPVARLATSFRMFVHFATADPTRGWVLLRTMPLVGAVNKEMRVSVRSQFGAALASGRLANLPIDTAVDLGLGMVIMTIRRILAERAKPPCINKAAEVLLLALGLDRASAATLSTVSLDLTASDL